jgi:hypothetical protein
MNTGASLNLSSLFGLIGNLIPFLGVLHWQWDPFQLLMLYWMETVILTGFTLARITTIPKHLLGSISVNGIERPATHRDLLKLFGGMAATFISVHFLFLWLLFSGDWSKTVRGPISFVRIFVIESGAWIPLLFAVFAGALSFLVSPTPPQFMRDLQTRFLRAGAIETPPVLDEADHGVGAVVGGLLSRIVIMQTAVIGGAMLAQTYGTQAPILIAIGLKTLFDLRAWPLKGVTISTKTRIIGRKAKKQSFRLPD